MSGAWHQFQSDLVDMQEFRDQNDGCNWILMTIDVFSKMAWAIPVKLKDSKHMLDAFKVLFEEKTKAPRKLQTDRGQEFRNHQVQTYLKTMGVKWFASEDDVVKAGVVERLNRTIKGKMWKYFHHKKSNRWLEVLPKLMHSYNHTVHSSIKMTPEEASTPEKEVEVRSNLYGPQSRLQVEEKAPQQLLKKHKFAVGDLVKLSKHAMVFDRGYKPNWTIEIMKVTEVLQTNPAVYRVRDQSGEEIKGVFYDHELQKVTSQPEVHDIEEVLQRQGDKLYVKWKGYSPKFNSWIQESSLIQY